MSFRYWRAIASAPMSVNTASTNAIRTATGAETRRKIAYVNGCVTSIAVSGINVATFVTPSSFAIETAADFFRQRAGDAKPEVLHAFLARAPNRKPDAGDEHPGLGPD